MEIGLGNLNVVTSTEFWHQELRAGHCFHRGVNLGPTVGNYSHVQLFNPVASGKQLIAYYALVSLGGANILSVRVDNTARANLYGLGANLLAGAADGVGQLRYEDNVALQGAPTLEVLRMLANDPRPVVPVWWVELSPGQGRTFVQLTQNAEIIGQFWWREV